MSSTPSVTLTLEEVRERRVDARQAGLFEACRVWEELEKRIQEELREQQAADRKLRARIVRDVEPGLKVEDDGRRWEARLVALLYRRGPMTSVAIDRAIDGELAALTTYLSRLKRVGLIEETGERRETSNGGYAQLLRCTWSPNGDQEDPG